MAGHVITGEAILENSQVIGAETPLESIEALVAQHSLMVFRIAYSVLRNHHDAEDAAQECFLRALKYGKSLRQVRNPKTWLARIVWTVALDRRSQRNTVSLDEQDATGERLHTDLPDPGTAADDQIAGRELQQLLQRLIAGLPDDLRQPLELSTVQELNSAEIAELMNIPEGSVRTRLMRARKLLKEKLSSVLEAKHG
jgi:RNA polymerase sigma-70 factor (ECF subfamily)